MSVVAMELAGVTFGYPTGAVVLDGARLRVPVASRLALLGANGCGKTTVLRLLAGALRPAAGQVLRAGAPIAYSHSGLRVHRVAVQLVVQDPDDQLFAASVGQDVSFGPMNLGLPVAQVRQRVTEALELLAISHLADRPTHLLSFGERKRVAIAGAVAMRPEVLVLDEPTAGLDPAAVAETLVMLERLRGYGATIVLSTHDVDLAMRWADQVAVVVDGAIIQGEPAEVLADEDLLLRARLGGPWVLRVAARLRALGLIGALSAPRTVDELLAGLPLAGGDLVEEAR